MADFSLRGIPEDLYETLRRAADRNHRSINGEILARLEASLRPVTVDVDALLARVREREDRTALACLDDDLLRDLKEVGRP